MAKGDVIVNGKREIGNARRQLRAISQAEKALEKQTSFLGEQRKYLESTISTLEGSNPADGKAAPAKAGRKPKAEVEAAPAKAGRKPKAEVEATPKKAGRKPKAEAEAEAPVKKAGRKPKAEAEAPVKKAGRKPKAEVEETPTKKKKAKAEAPVKKSKGKKSDVDSYELDD